MVIHIDEKRRVVLNLGLAWTIVVFLIVSAFYLGVAVTELKRSDAIQSAELSNHENRLKAIEDVNARVATSMAVIDTKLDTIQRDLAEVKAAQKEQSRLIAAEKTP
jgi:hypothetical protein